MRYNIFGESMKTKTQKSLNIISYNLKYHRAFNELVQLAEKYKTDFICAQECYSSLLPRKIHNLHLADATRENRLGLAIYFNPKRFDVVKSKSFPLKKSFHDRVLAPAQERLLVTKLSEKNTSREIVVGSFHAACLTASNSTRRKQITEAHEILKSIGRNNPTIMVGDYNYPVFKRGLRVCIEKSGYKLNLSDQPTYVMAKLLRAHFDLTTSFNATIEQVKTLPKGLSDHKPILIQASL